MKTLSRRMNVNSSLLFARNFSTSCDHYCSLWRTAFATSTKKKIARFPKRKRARNLKTRTSYLATTLTSRVTWCHSKTRASSLSPNGLQTQVNSSAFAMTTSWKTASPTTACSTPSVRRQSFQKRIKDSVSRSISKTREARPSNKPKTSSIRRIIRRRP